MDKLLDWRPEFPILSHTTYLISNSLGAMPRGVSSALEQYTKTWGERGVRAWEESWWDLSGQVAKLVSPLIGGAGGQISLHQNVTITQAVISSCFDFSGPRNKIVLTELEFPSIQYFYLEQRRRGADVQIVPNEDKVRLDVSRFLEAIDENTLLVPISLVLFRSAHLVDARAIVEKAHSVGAFVILDTYQAAGTVPVNVDEIGADFCVGGVLKWLCAGPGVAYLYVRNDVRSSMKPDLTGWLAHKRPFAFETGSSDMREDAYGFLNGTPQIPALYACQPGLALIGKIPIADIREKSLRMTTRIMEGARARGWHVNTPENPAERGGTVSINCPHAAQVCSELIRREVLVDYRPEAGIRFSPHFYNCEEECDFGLAQMDEILAKRTWESRASA
jgi:kynureninase